jgi:hypothetical protein
VDHGQAVSKAELGDVPKEDWPLERFTPTSSDLLASGATVAVGLLLTLAISRLGSKAENDPDPLPDSSA